MKAQGWREHGRKTQIRIRGASYHVISWGNYRADVFAADTTNAAFINCMGEASEKSSWVVHFTKHRRAVRQTGCFEKRPSVGSQCLTAIVDSGCISLGMENGCERCPVRYELNR